jgi:stage V sporulation protein D (sporulation-specific penicillin-binding protein)
MEAHAAFESFIGFAPADDPQIAIYCVVDRPNVADQPHATYATGIVRNILTEVLPYLHIAKTEEMTIAEQEEIDRLLGGVVQEETPQDEDGNTPEGEQAPNEGNNSPSGEESGGTPAYVVDPDTGELVNPITGEKAQMDYNIEGEDDSSGGGGGSPPQN